MDAQARRDQLLKLLNMDIKPVNASNLAEHFQVSRQIIVGDVAILRAAGADIIATPKGYILNKSSGGEDVAGADTYVLACSHDKASLEAELYAIVDNGGTIINVTIDHPLYGNITQLLDIRSRYDADVFLKKVAVSGAALLCELTGGVHLHTVRCPEPEAYRRILHALRQAGVLYVK